MSKFFIPKDRYSEVFYSESYYSERSFYESCYSERSLFQKVQKVTIPKFWILKHGLLE